jgi:hypothetical protein
MVSFSSWVELLPSAYATFEPRADGQFFSARRATAAEIVARSSNVAGYLPTLVHLFIASFFKASFTFATFGPRFGTVYY